MGGGLDPDDLLGEEVSGIVLEEVLGGGRAGHVFRGKDCRSGLEVAVRVLPRDSEHGPENLARLEREFRSTSRLDHPNLVRNLRIEVAGEIVLMVMEYVAGPDLETLLSRGPLPIERAAGLAAQLVRVVGYLRGEGFLHRDLKPSNVFVASGDEVRLGDLELIKSVCPSNVSMVTAPGTVVGSPAYLAPELLSEDAEPSPGTDAYSLGATLYHLFTGRPPYSGRTGVEVLRRAIQGPPVPIQSVHPAIPDRIASIVEELMASDPSRRPGVDEALARRIESALPT